MILSKADFIRLVSETADAQGKMAAMRERLAEQKAANEWLMHRLTQLELERAALISRYMGINIPVAQPAADTPAGEHHVLSELPDFNDVGDEEAKRLGISWDTEGRVVQHGKAIS